MQQYDWREDIKTRYSGDYGELRVSHLHNADFARLNTSARYAIKYVNYGTEAYYVDNQEVTINTGDLLVLQNNESYMAQVPTQSVTQGLCIDLSDRLFDSIPTPLMDDEHTLPGIDMNLAVFPKSVNQLGELLSHIASIGPYEQLAMQEHMNELHVAFKEFLLPYQLKTDTLPFKKSSTKKEVFGRLLKAQAFIHDNSTQMFKLKELADTAHISEFHFLRLFKHFFGCTPGTYLEKIKMERAKSMIETRNYRLKEVAYELGYPDQQYFSRRFKKYFGYTPSSLKKEQKSA